MSVFLWIKFAERCKFFFLVEKQGKWGIVDVSGFAEGGRGTYTGAFEYLSTASRATRKRTQGTHVSKKVEFLFLKY